MDRPLPAYAGDEPYIFVSYSHEDSARVYAEIEWLNHQGFKVWYDDGLSPGRSWREELAQRIEQCALFLFFVSERSIRSAHCVRETNFAIDRDRDLIAVHLGEAKLTSGLELMLGDRQAILMPRLSTAAYQAKLLEAVEGYVPRTALPSEDLGKSEPTAVAGMALARPEQRGIGYLTVATLTLLALAVTWLVDIDLTASLIISALCLVCGAAGTFAVHTSLSSRTIRWAHTEAIPDIVQSLEHHDLFRAYAIATQLDSLIPDDPVLAKLWNDICVPASLITEPAGAMAYFKPYDEPEAPWQFAGNTPLDAVRLPRGALRWTLEKDGYRTRFLASRNASVMHGNDSEMLEQPTIVLRRLGSAHEEMVDVPGGAYPLTVSGFNVIEPVNMPEYLIDCHPVSNAEFKDFVDADGYREAAYWHDLEFECDGAALTRQEAVAAFVDLTGHFGPAGWELGSHPAGADELPVTGISWYEACAYARFRGKELPTIFHWYRAAMPIDDARATLSPNIAAAGNFADNGPSARGVTKSLGPYGTFDQAGNVREWGHNAAGPNRWIMGGGWCDPDYLFNFNYDVSPWDRSEVNGFRCMIADTDYDPGLRRGLTVATRDYTVEQPIGDEARDALFKQLSYHASTVVSRVERVDTESSPHWCKEKVVVATGYDEAEMPVWMYLPKDGATTHRALIYFPHVGAFLEEVPGDDWVERDFATHGLEMLIRSGLALVMPTFDGACERFNGFLSVRGRAYYAARSEQIVHWRQDLGCVIDYLETRDDIDNERIASLGISSGVNWFWPLLACEPRIKTAIAASGGLPPHKEPDIADAKNYLALIEQPVLLLNGRFDALNPLGPNHDRILEWLGSTDKRRVVFDAGHSPLPRYDFVREVMQWLDKRVPVP